MRGGSAATLCFKLKIMRVAQLILPTVTLLAIFGAVFAISARVEIEHTARLAELRAHNFDRALIIEASPDERELTDERARQFMSFSAQVQDGAGAVLKAEDAARLLGTNFVEGAYAVSNMGWELRLPDGRTTNVTALNATAEFLNAFSIARQVVTDQYVPSSNLIRDFGAVSAGSARLGLSRKQYDDLAPVFKSRITYNDATIPVVIADKTAELPYGFSAFERALITTKQLPRVNMNGIKMIPAMRLFVLLRRNVDVAEALHAVRAFAVGAKAAQPFSRLSVTSASEVFLQEVTGSYLGSWSVLEEATLLLAGWALSLLALVPSFRRAFSEAVLKIAHGVDLATVLRRTYLPLAALAVLTPFVAGFQLLFLSASLEVTRTLLSGIAAMVGLQVLTFAMLLLAVRRALAIRSVAVSVDH